MEKDMDLVKNIFMMVIYFLKVNLEEEKNGQVKVMTLKQIKSFMKLKMEMAI